MMEYMYLRKKKLKWIELAVLCGASYVVFKMFMLRLAFVLTILCIVLYIIVVKYSIINLKWKVLGFITKTGFAICAAVSILLAYFYNADSSWMAKIDELSVLVCITDIRHLKNMIYLSLDSGFK